MSENVWTQKELERLIRHFIDENGGSDPESAQVAKWAKGRGYTMPTPQTDVELLTALLSRAAVSAKRKDAKTSIHYRALLAYPIKVNGERRTRWFDADGATATAERIMASFHRRKDYALNILTSAAATVEHWFRTHPKEKREQLDLGIAHEEVMWRLMGPSTGSGEEQKSG